MTKLINSKFIALLMGGWIVYCLTVKAFDGALFLLTIYLFALYENKKATNGAKFGDTAPVND
ncbi:hypothetical protein [Limosilactobacillus reuteri]|uniref:hypothetical protein n=1 Tax=Limosilactobacillus reuteri TaxID=1598 RepID=UPI000A2DF1E0|nr:hypothetical protein [Limosilactobacillus reuteri]OTA45643.1 hypothetical protein BHL74_05640 [Limosilactobacillus reuteri]